MFELKQQVVSGNSTFIAMHVRAYGIDTWVIFRQQGVGPWVIHRSFMSPQKCLAALHQEIARRQHG